VPSIGPLGRVNVAINVPKKRWCNGGKREIEWNFIGIFKEY